MAVMYKVGYIIFNTIMNVRGIGDIVEQISEVLHHMEHVPRVWQLDSSTEIQKYFSCTYLPTNCACSSKMMCFIVHYTNVHMHLLL